MSTSEKSAVLDSDSAVVPFVQEGGKLVGTPSDGDSNQGTVAVSADGNTAVVGGANDGQGTGAIWIFTRASGTWTQQGGKLVGNDELEVKGKIQKSGGQAQAAYGDLKEDVKDAAKGK